MVQNRYEIGTKSVVQKILFSRWLFGENKSPTIAIVGRGVKKLRFLENSQIDNVSVCRSLYVPQGVIQDFK